MVNADLLLAKMVECGFRTQLAYCKKYNINKNTFNNKIHGKTAFTTDEVIEICKNLNITDDNLKVQIFLA